MNTGLLDQLAPAHAPSAPGLWPLAPGYWALIVLALMCLLAVAIWQRRLIVRQRRAALRELAQIDQNSTNDAQLAAGLENLLRRYAVARFGRESVAHLSGVPWIEFVATHGGTILAGEAGQNFLTAAYGGKARRDRSTWLIAARGFIRRSK